MPASGIKNPQASMARTEGASACPSVRRNAFEGRSENSKTVAASSSSSQKAKTSGKAIQADMTQTSFSHRSQVCQQDTLMIKGLVNSFNCFPQKTPYVCILSKCKVTVIPKSQPALSNSIKILGNKILGSYLLKDLINLVEIRFSSVIINTQVSILPSFTTYYLLV